MIKIVTRNDLLLLVYTAQQRDIQWVDDELQNDGHVTIGKIFTFNDNNVVEEIDTDPFSGDSRTFLLGALRNNFFKIDRSILALSHDLFLSADMPINRKTFIAARNISVFRKIDKLIEEPIVVGGDTESSIPISEFEKLLHSFPTSTELNHYSDARVTRVLKDYLGTMTDAQTRLENYTKRKQTVKTVSHVELLREPELRKFKFIRDSLLDMLKNSDSYLEVDWQNIILDFLLLLFPKYVAILPNLHIKDFYSKPGKSSDRYIDLTLVDANGNIDIVEIKRPFEHCIISARKYRDNYTPKLELSGSVMQLEKYIFHLKKWGADGERKINKKRKDELPNNMEVKITNPKGLIILGRDIDFENDQKFDFEIIKRKFANIIDIITYDDLLQRLDNIISKFINNK